MSKQGLKEQLHAEIAKNYIKDRTDIMFVPRMTGNSFFSDDFSQLSRARQLEELHVHEITKSCEDFVPHIYSFPSLYEEFLRYGFEIKDMTPEQIEEYIKKRQELDAQVNPKAVKLEQEKVELEDEYMPLEDKTTQEAKYMKRKLEDIETKLTKYAADSA